MNTMRVITSITTLAASTALTACYVVPIHPSHSPAYPPTAHSAVVVAPELPLQMTARLYPANDLASSYGMLTANVTNQLNGKGQFTVNVAGETLQGEATRSAGAGVGSGRSGTASAAGPRGTFMQCSYTMNHASMGSGNCKLNNGAQFSMHVGG